MIKSLLSIENNCFPDKLSLVCRCLFAEKLTNAVVYRYRDIAGDTFGLIIDK
jgi:hypothetical protein